MKLHLGTTSVLVGLALAFSQACGDDGGGDSSVSDASGADAVTADARARDAAEGDANSPDAQEVDAFRVDSDIVDSASDAREVTPVMCDDDPVITYAASGLPLMQSNPGAALAIFLDFDGGTYHSHSSDSYTDYGPYNRSGSAGEFDEEEQRDIILAWSRTRQYFAMFDINITTDESAATSAAAWGWIVITEDVSGGRGSKSRTAIGTERFAHSVVGSSTARSENRDKARRIAHELGHNFRLEHSGVWEDGTFYKWEDWPEWDRVYGPIMGGGGKGERNGWSLGAHSDDPTTTQDTMDIISSRVRAIDPLSPGWAVDDFRDDVASALCQGDGLYRHGVLGHPEDVDRFQFTWRGGTVRLRGVVPDVSAALLSIELVRDGVVIGTDGEHAELAPGLYEVRVRSRGGYGELGEYEVYVD